MAPLNQGRDRVLLPLEDGFDGAVVTVLHPAGHAAPARLLLAGVTKEHTLHATVHHHATANDRHDGILRSRGA